MATDAIFDNGNTILVTTEGPGKLHLFSWGSTWSQKRTGFVETKRAGKSRFVIGFAYGYTNYAFYWEGEGKAEYRTSNDKTRHPVGNSWKQAVGVEFPNHHEAHMVEVPEEDFHGGLNGIQDVTVYLLSEQF